MELKRVVVTGLGAITPLGNNVDTTWKSMLEGVSGAGPITLFDASKFKTHFACEVKGFNPLDHFDKKESRKYDRYTQFALVAAKEAVEDSGLDIENEDTDNIGVIISSGIGGLSTFEEEIGYYFLHEDQGPKINPFFIPKMISDIASGVVSMKYKFRGPNFGTVSACASSTNGAICAYDLIRLGKAKVMLTGGAEAAVSIAGVGGFNALTALSTRNDSPGTASRPFSKSRDGFVIGEGSACLVFEELNHALERGAKIYAEVGGGGASGDAYHLTAPHPEGIGIKLAMERTLDDAGMQPENIDYINVHGTSTPAGDIPEINSIKEIFGEAAYKLNISSTKSMTGHMLGAAGAVEALASVLSVKEDIVPPTINHEEGDDDPEIDYKLNLTFNKAQKRIVRAALSNTFGFGGHNACIIVKKFEK